MTSQESQVLETFLNQLVQARPGAKDPQAETLIADAVARQPDAAYLLVQRALLLEHALSAAKAEIQALQNKLQSSQAAGAGNFLDPANAWGNSASSRPMAPPAAPMPAPTPMPAQGPAMQPPARSGFLSGGLGSTLGNIAATAAGVAGGAFLFQGIENLLHHNSGSGFLAQPAMGYMPTETTVVNNYYGSDTPSSDLASDADSGGSFFDDAGDSFSSDDSYI